MRGKLKLLLLALVGILALCEGTGAAGASFDDVPEDAYNAGAVQWAVERNITLGTSPGKFSPQQTCTKAQIVTFLWRACGSPEPTLPPILPKVPAGAYYEKAALWAREKALFTDTAFDPDSPCSRADVARYLWTLAGCPQPSRREGFQDVSPGDSLADAVYWAVEQGITMGTSENRFSPHSACTRGQIAMFLFRADSAGHLRNGAFVTDNRWRILAVIYRHIDAPECQKSYTENDIDGFVTRLEELPDTLRELSGGRMRIHKIDIVVEDTPIRSFASRTDKDGVVRRSLTHGEHRR